MSKKINTELIERYMERMKYILLDLQAMFYYIEKVKKEYEQVILILEELIESAKEIADTNKKEKITEEDTCEKYTEEEYIDLLGNMLVAIDNRGCRSEAEYLETISVSLNILSQFFIEKELYRIKNVKEEK